MFEKENLHEGVVLGVLLGVVIGVVVAWILKVSFISWIFILSLGLLPGFFIMTMIYFFRVKKEKVLKADLRDGFDWGVEVNLRKVQIVHSRYVSMISSAVWLAVGAFVVMAFIAMDFPGWGVGHMIFFSLATIIFIGSLHMGFRWWLRIRDDYRYLKFLRDVN